MLCRNAIKLDPCQSLHWPRSVEGRWIPAAGRRTKLLVIEALVVMTLSGPANESALRSIAARLYSIWRDEPAPEARGCIGKMISALMERLEKLPYKEFMQGNSTVTLGQLEEAADSSGVNPDGYLDHLSTELADDLREWAATCSGRHRGHGRLATAEHGAHEDDETLAVRTFDRLRGHPA
ncbi:hypothetical protein [Actinomadura sp. DC4]|uniref:hypothetical protein n=1 Tax=Actinomadura sp. DC4 TaxID=3055069 RepID=UPI0025B244FB|nr:hypothetical protein [Actinomadura sp. DC4]MDN3359144.1 hypothetical protein [Actinomadura sp. DC4]